MRFGRRPAHAGGVWRVIAGDRGQVDAQRLLVARKQRTRSDGEILAALAATVAERTARPAAIIRAQATTMRANGSAIRFGPTELAERHLYVPLRQSEDIRKADTFRSGTEEKMLGHGTSDKLLSNVR